MEHRTSAELKGLRRSLILSLEKRKGARLRTLREVEYKPGKEQSALRQENPPDRSLRGRGAGARLCVAAMVTRIHVPTCLGDNKEFGRSAKASSDTDGDEAPSEARRLVPAASVGRLPTGTALTCGRVMTHSGN
jgi:hypothetical protein